MMLMLMVSQPFRITCGPRWRRGAGGGEEGGERVQEEGRLRVGQGGGDWGRLGFGVRWRREVWSWGSRGLALGSGWRNGRGWDGEEGKFGVRGFWRRRD